MTQSNASEKKTWDYVKKGEVKLTPEFKKQFVVAIKGKEAIKVDGLKTLAHEKGIKRLEVDIIQFPTKENNNTCIVKAYLEGYDYDPIEKKVTVVKYSAIGDASPSNCTAMVANAFIRMAETRALGRVLRNYTDIAMVASEEIFNPTETVEPGITDGQLATVTAIMTRKNLSKQVCNQILKGTHGNKSLKELTEKEADILIRVMEDYEVTQDNNVDNTSNYSNPNAGINEDQLTKITKIMKEKQLSKETCQNVLREVANGKSLKQLTVVEADNLIAKMEEM